MKKKIHKKRHCQKGYREHSRTLSSFSIFTSTAILTIVFVSLSFYFLGNINKTNQQIGSQATNSNSGIISKPTVQYKDNEPQKCSDVCLETSRICEDSCHNSNNYNIAVGSGNISVCEQITVKDIKLNCMDSIIQQKALKEGNALLCDKISNAAAVEACRNRVLQNRAIFDDDASSCDKISDLAMKTDCHDSIFQKKAMEENDIQLCSEIVNDATRNRCTGTILRDKAAMENNKSICIDIIDAFMKASCLDVFIQRKAVKEDNVSLCEQMSNELAVASCIRIVSHKISRPIEVVERENAPEKAVSSLDICIEDCYEVNKACEESCIDNGYFTKAMLKNDKNLCNKIKDEAQQINCLDKITLNTALEEKDQDICRQMSTAENRISCTRDVMRKLANTLK